MTDIRDLLGEGFPAVELYKEVTKAAHALKSRERPYFVDKADAMRDELLTALRERDEEVKRLRHGVEGAASLMALHGFDVHYNCGTWTVDGPTRDERDGSLPRIRDFLLDKTPRGAQ